MCAIKSNDRDENMPRNSRFPEKREDQAGRKNKQPKPSGKQKKENPYLGLKVAAIILSIVLFCELLYCVVVFSNIPFCVNMRTMFIDTALDTMTHRWLADYTMPKYMVAQREQAKVLAGQQQFGQNSKRPKPAQPTVAQEELPSESVEPEDPQKPLKPEKPEKPDVNADEEAFYDLYWELNRSSFEAYLDEHPEVLANGWNNIYINEAGIYDDGTSIYTSMGEQVLAIDVPNKLLLLRVQGSGYLGILAVGKDPAQLRCEASTHIGSFGQPMGEMVTSHNGVIGITANGFLDPEGNGNGGTITGYSMCGGKDYGYHYREPKYKRIELTEDNKMYITDTLNPVASDVTDAAEFEPSLIVDGEMTVGGFYDWNSNNPRACIGQSARDEILMLVIEGRQLGRSIGCDVETCANILMRHEAYTAMNMDGGTSAIMWYDGEYVTKCSNQNISSRYLPNAWVYGYAE